MPCYETRLTTVDFGQQTHIGALADALRAEGHTVSVEGETSIAGMTRDGYSFAFSSGRFRVDERSSIARDVNATKRAYSREVVKREAKRAGWQARFVGDSFTLTRRRY